MYNGATNISRLMKKLNTTVATNAPRIEASAPESPFELALLFVDPIFTGNEILAPSFHQMRPNTVQPLAQPR